LHYVCLLVLVPIQLNIYSVKIISEISIKPIVTIRLKSCGEGNKLVNMVHVGDSNFKSIHFISEYAMVFNIAVDSTQFGACYSVISIANCSFHKIKANFWLRTQPKMKTIELWKPWILVEIRSIYFDLLSINGKVILLISVDLFLKRPVIFTNIETSGIIYALNSHVQMHDYIEVSFSEGDYCLGTSYIVLKENTLLNITEMFLMKFFLQHLW